MGVSKETVGVSPGAEYSPAPPPSESPGTAEAQSGLASPEPYRSQAERENDGKTSLGMKALMGHENFDDMCERYQDAKAAGTMWMTPSSTLSSRCDLPMGESRPGEQDKSISCLGGLCANSLGSESLYCTD